MRNLYLVFSILTGVWFIDQIIIRRQEPQYYKGCIGYFILELGRR